MSSIMNVVTLTKWVFCDPPRHVNGPHPNSQRHCDAVVCCLPPGTCNQTSNVCGTETVQYDVGMYGRGNHETFVIFPEELFDLTTTKIS